ncbi:MAG TPA: flagellar export chaperone FliS [Candidatus Aquilonibacter sp.]
MKYLEASIATASKEDLMVKIFDAIVLFTRKAIERMKTEPNDIQGRHNLLRTAQRACGAAVDAIDFELGGELAQSNCALYQFWYRELVMANVEGDVARAEGVLPQMEMIRNAWAEAVRRYKLEFASVEPRAAVAVV